MGALRTINHPGIQINEYDLSDYVATVGGTTSLVIGFSPQGQAGVPVMPTSTSSVKSYFGIPKTEAERYFFYACKEVFDKGGNLIAARIPYNNNAQYLTPTVTYDIETWSTTHTKTFGPAFAVATADMEKLTGASDFDMSVENLNALVCNLNVDDKKSSKPTKFKTTTKSFTVYCDKDAKVTTEVTAIDKFYYMTVNRTASLSTDGAAKESDIKLDDAVLKKTVSKEQSFSFIFKKVTNTVDEEEVTDEKETGWYLQGKKTEKVDIQTLASEYGVTFTNGVKFTDSDMFVITCAYAGVELNASGADFYRIEFRKKGEKSCGGKLTKALDNPDYFIVRHYKDAQLWYRELEVKLTDTINIDNDSGSKIDGRTLYADIVSDGKVVIAAGRRLSNGDNQTIIDAGYSVIQVYVDENREIYKGCTYNPVKQGGVNYPTLTVVEKYNDTSHEDVVAVKAYYLDGEGAVYPSCISTNFMQYKLTDDGIEVLANAGIEPASGDEYTPEQIVENVRYLSSDSYFTLTNCDFVATVEKEAVALSKSFRAAPVSSDVTSGFDISEKLAIPACDDTVTWADVEDDYPSIMTADPYEDGNYRYVAKTIPGDESYAYSKDDFYEFVSTFTTISGVAYAGSQNYQWIHWKTCATSADTTDEEVASYVDNSIMVSALAGMRQKDVPQGLADIENLVTIKPNTDHFGFIPLSTFQDYRDGAKTPDANKIVICNINEKQFAADDYNNSGMECLGIMPVLIGGMQAIPKQQIVQLPDDVGNGRIFNAVEAVVRGNLYDVGIPESEGVNCKYSQLNSEGFYKSLATTDSFAPYDSNISNDMLGNVPSIQLNSELKPDGVQKNEVTLVVCELSVSSSFDNKVYVNVIEKWTGSLDKDAVDEKNKSIFIDNIVNSEDSGSSYVRIFTNFSYSDNFKETSTRNKSEYVYVNEQTNDNTATVVVPASLGTDLWFTKPKEAMSLGFTTEQTKKYIAYSTIAATLESIFDTLSNVDETVIDVVVDAGLSTIANRIKRLGDADPEVIKAEYAPFWERIKDVDCIAGWKSICAKYITFCSSTRKDCMAVVDAPRNLSVYNDVKLVKNTKYSIDFDIMPSITYLAGLNSSYCAQYANWISYVDDFSGKTVWLPPSIMANGAIIYTDYNAQYFDAPAGTKRGLITAGIDVSFNPNARQQDNLYGKSWNYCLSTTSDGIVIWGQKTSQTRTSAFDRINVRRLFLRLERLTRNAVKTFLFEGNTEKLRNRVVDMLTPIYENCKTNGGLYDYQIICDSRNNTDTSIDNNELRIAIALKPTKTAEFIILDFFALSTGADFSEIDSYL